MSDTRFALAPPIIRSFGAAGYVFSACNLCTRRGRLSSKRLARASTHLLAQALYLTSVECKCIVPHVLASSVPLRAPVAAIRHPPAFARTSPSRFAVPYVLQPDQQRSAAASPFPSWRYHAAHDSVPGGSAQASIGRRRHHSKRTRWRSLPFPLSAARMSEFTAPLVKQRLSVTGCRRGQHACDVGQTARS